jgi:hypothetical protein
MNHRDDPIEWLIAAVIDGRCDEAGLHRLAELVRDDPRARAAYVDQMRMHALLNWRHGRVGMTADGRRPAADGSGSAGVTGASRRSSCWGAARCS